MDDSIELRNALISFYKDKGQKIHFLVNFEIDYVYVYYIKYNDLYIKVIYIKPKINKKEILVIGSNRYRIRVCIGNLDKKDKFELLKPYKEPYPGAWNNDNPFSRKKQKPNKRR